MGHKTSKETRQKISRATMGRDAVKGERHYLWKGERVSYSGLHIWLKNNFGQPNICEECGKKKQGHYIHWANKSGEYKRVREDWIRLCAKCHWWFDRNRT